MAKDNNAAELIRKLSKIVLELVGDLEDAEAIHTEGRYAKEMEVYDQAIAWLREHNRD